MCKKLQLSPILASVLLLACPREGSAGGLADSFLYSADVQVNGYTSAFQQRDFPLLVRIGPERIRDFSYDDAGANGSSLGFELVTFAADGTVESVETVPHEIDTWNPDGESLVWVRHPSLSNDYRRRLRLYWKLKTGASPPTLPSARVWGDYVSVWHMTGDYDSARDHLLTTLGEGTLARADGAVGGALGSRLTTAGDRVFSSERTEELMALTNSGFTASMWLNVADVDTHGAYVFLYGFDSDEKTALAAVRFSGGGVGDATALTVFPGASGASDGLAFDLSGAFEYGEWSLFDFVVTNGFAEVWVNGSCLGRRLFAGTVGSAPVAVAEAAATDPFNVDFDEVRLKPGVIAPLTQETDLRVVAEYRQVVDADYTSFGETYYEGRLLNRWVSEPSLDPLTWSAGEKISTLSLGVPQYGYPEASFLDLSTAVVYPQMPEVKGKYRMFVKVAESEEYTALSWSIDFSITAGVTPGGVASADDFANSSEFKVLAGALTPAMTSGSPMLIRVMNDSPAGFYFENLCFGATEAGFLSDVRFYSDSGDILDYEIERWDTVNGVLVWVSVPNLAAGRKVIMCWGQGAGTKLPENDPSAVWPEGTTDTAKSALKESYLANYAGVVSVSPVVRKASFQIENRWLREPSLTPSSWLAGETSGFVDTGATYGDDPAHGIVPRVVYMDRNSGEILPVMPKSEVGEYRAVFTFPGSSRWSALIYEINFRIVAGRPEYAYGDGSDGRVLLANDDYSVEGAQVEFQSYDDSDASWGLPYWKHLDAAGLPDDSGTDFTSLNPYYNLFGGTHHEYRAPDNARLWGLIDVRFGNTFPNGRWYPAGRGVEGLDPRQNFLPWNPSSQRMLGYLNYTVGDFREYAGTFLLRNTLSASINSKLYQDGIGTVYFDAVNGWADNVTNAEGQVNYRLELQVATTLVGSTVAPADEFIGSSVDGVWDPYYGADWKPVKMHVLRFRGQACERFETDSLKLEAAAGGSVTNFYRVYAPVDVAGPARFRIVRTAIDPNYTYNPDGEAMILVDNVLVSRPAERFDVIPYGWYDPEKSDKYVLGQEGAFDPPFPGVGDRVTARAKAVDRFGNEVGPDRISSVTMHYRWHYLEQSIIDWQYVDIDVNTMTAISPLAIPATPGDVDFWFDGSQNGTYFTYVDYSGTALGVPGYSEAVDLITNGLDTATSTGWYFRIRDGRSDTEEIKLIVREPAGGGTVVREVPFAMFEEHTWRGFYQTTNAIAAGVDFRLERRNVQTRGDREFAWNTNSYYSTESIDAIQYSTRVVPGTAGDWTHIPVDAATGYLMFQLDESTMGLTIVHADYQNFNDWTDANGPRFVGASAGGGIGAGVSAKSREFPYDWSEYPDTVATNDLWRCDFDDANVRNVAKVGYRLFAAGDPLASYMDWTLGKGQFVYGGYRDPRLGGAVQLAGKGEGYVQLVNPLEKPRGVEKVEFNARIAQNVRFGNFATSDHGVGETANTFYAGVAFDLKKNCGFTGNASLSLVANYRDGRGCYEARWEQVSGLIDTQYGTLVRGVDRQGQRLSLYRWNKDNSVAGYTVTLLACVTNSVKTNWKFSIPETTSADSGLTPFFISTWPDANGNVCVMAGVHMTSASSSAAPASNSGWKCLTFCDNSAQKLVSGNFGVQSANCEGHFVNPQWSNAAVTLGGDFPAAPGLTASWEAADTSTESKKITFPVMTSVWGDLDDGWSIRPGRMEKFGTDAGTAHGLRATSVAQSADVYIAPVVESGGTWSVASESDWVKVGDAGLQGFGTVTAQVWVPESVGVWKTPDCAVRIKSGGSLYDDITASADGEISPDIVVDSIEFTQWRGETEDRSLKPSSSYYNANSAPGDYVYTSGWIVDGALRLAAKRTQAADDRHLAEPCSIRTPLFDGMSGRGHGFGMIGFSYANVRSATARLDTPLLLVQVATNVSYTMLNSLTDTVETGGPGDAGTWQTVAVLTPRDLGSSGTTNLYFGYHGIATVARLIVAPELVQEMADIGEEAQFPSIDILAVTCKDEPPIDKGCWWGWNLRTVGGDGDDAEKRMYLPDFRIPVAPGSGMSLALNNSITADVDPEVDPHDWPLHMPFLQSPTFASNVVGEVQFKARKYDFSTLSQPATVTLYGAKPGDDLDDDSAWTELATFAVSNTLFETYSWKAGTGSKYRAFRLAVTGVEGVDYPGPAPAPYATPVRVLIDEAVVSEAIDAKLAFRNVGAFRSDLKGDAWVPGVPSKAEQPMVGEEWGVQAELYAVMMENEIDMLHEPRVKIYWYRGLDKWGYENWKDDPSVESGYMTRCSDTNMIYRSSLIRAPKAVIPKSEQPEVVQYMLEVEYWVINSKTGASEPVTALMGETQGDWVRPDWFAPVDYNSDPLYGDGKTFAGFNILERVPAGWAWINEVNIQGGIDEDEGWINYDELCQYIEIAAPVEADMSGWSVRIVENGGNLSTAYTNTIAEFGNRDLGTTKDSLYSASNMVFYVIANKSAENAGNLKRSDGTFDGSWLTEGSPYVFNYDGTISYFEPFGIQLVSPQGVVFHEVTVVGTNIMAQWVSEYDPERMAEAFNAMGDSRFFYAGDDGNVLEDSLSVLTGSGGVRDDWFNDVVKTPGRINEGQYINPDHPVANGESIVVYASVDTAFGHIAQVAGAATSPTNETQVIVLPKGNEGGTNITYVTDRWYELESVTQDGVPITPLPAASGQRTWVVNVGRGFERNVQIIATARVEERLRDYGLDENNPYTPAVIDWLTKGTTINPNVADSTFENPDGDIALATYRHHATLPGVAKVEEPMTLTEMYWLDIDPTASNFVFEAGFTMPILPGVVVDGYRANSSLTNLKTSVFMMITNETERTTSKYYHKVWSPYVLRSLDPQVTSWDYAADSSWAWTSVTFQVRGLLANGLTSELNKDNWLPLRWFVFMPDSFYQPGNALGKDVFTTDLEVLDPVSSKDSPGYGAGWADWVREHGPTPVFFGWNINTTLMPFSVEILRPENYYEP